MSLKDKIGNLIDSAAQDFTEVFAVPGSHSIIDGIHPETDRSIINGETLEQIQQRYPDAVRMLWEDWRQQQIARQQTPISWQQIDERKYAEMLDVLPPIEFGPNGFMVSEPVDHCHATGRPRYDAFICRNSDVFGRVCFASSRPMTRQEFRKVR